MMSSAQPVPRSGNAVKSDDRLVGVKLVRDRNHRPFSGDRGAQEKDVNDGSDRIGLVVTPLTVKLDEFRAVMVRQIPSQLPNKFGFLAANGCPVTDNQESMIELRSIVDSEPVVTIRKIFDKEPFGIRTTDGIAIGFVFADPNSAAAQLRALIDSTGIFPGRLSERLNTDDDIDAYQFVYRDEFPVATGQESSLTVWDLCRRGTISIIPVYRRNNERPPIDERPAAEFTIAGEFQSDPSVVGDSTDATPPSTAQPARITSSHSSWSRPISRAPTNTAEKSVMISYVTVEARERAVQLKRALESLNMTVFLDVNDIRLGAHWDDTLNRAVQSCHLFVALVTRSYGATEWTLLELRLAFQKRIPIVPINFLDNYPPESVAIYFSTLQHYSPAVKLPAGRGRSADYWEESFAEPIAREIVECFNREVYNSRPSSTIGHNSGVNHRNHQLRESGTLYDLPEEITLDDGLRSLGASVDETTETKRRPLVVISAHPTRKSMVELIKVELQRLAIDAWCSTDIGVNERNERSNQEMSTTVESPAVCDDNRDLLFLESNTTDGQFRHAMPNDDVDNYRLREDKGKAFLEIEKKADAMLVLVCKQYVKSKTSKQQAFYCCLSDKVLAFLYDTSESKPHWISMFKRSMTRGLQDTDEQLTLKITETVKEMLSECVGGEASEETAITGSVADESIVSVIQRNIVDVSPENAILVYFRGSFRDSTPKLQQLSHAIGQKLAAESNVVLISDGFSVESEIVSKSFIHYRNSNSDLFHVMCSSGQSVDFEILAKSMYGKVVRVNGSLHEIDSAVASLFDACFLMENSPRRDRIAELFNWKEKIVALIVDDSDIERVVANVVNSITRRSRRKSTVCFENNKSEAEFKCDDL